MARSCQPSATRSPSSAQPRYQLLCRSRLPGARLGPRHGQRIVGPYPLRHVEVVIGIDDCNVHLRRLPATPGDSYTIFTFTQTPSPAISVLWSVATADASSSRTGSSIFDFEGDGAAEVLYNDECYLRVYDGKTGNVLVQIASSSATANQYPIAVDVDGDHHTELVVVSDDKYQIHGFRAMPRPRRGVGRRRR